jgi:hypothetical protein
MEELVGFRSWKLEANKAFTRDDGLLTLTALDNDFALHGSSPELRVVLYVGQPVADGFRVLIGLAQAAAGLVDGSKHGDFVGSCGDFGLVFPEELVNEENFSSQCLTWRMVRRGIDLEYKIIPSCVARDQKAVAWLPAVQ